jgi:hypothetical protein
LFYLAFIEYFALNLPPGMKSAIDAPVYAIIGEIEGRIQGDGPPEIAQGDLLCYRCYRFERIPIGVAQNIAYGINCNTAAFQ